jgi:hypothetical protein
MTNNDLEERLIQLLRESGVGEDAYRRAYVRGQLRLLTKMSQKKQKPVAGFPFSLFEQAIRAGLSVIEQTVTILFDSVFMRSKR